MAILSDILAGGVGGLQGLQRGLERDRTRRLEDEGREREERALQLREREALIREALLNRPDTPAYSFRDTERGLIRTNPLTGEAEVVPGFEAAPPEPDDPPSFRVSRGGIGTEVSTVEEALDLLGRIPDASTGGDDVNWVIRQRPDGTFVQVHPRTGQVRELEDPGGGSLTGRLPGPTSTLDDSYADIIARLGSGAPEEEGDLRGAPLSGWRAWLERRLPGGATGREPPPRELASGNDPSIAELTDQLGNGRPAVRLGAQELQAQEPSIEEGLTGDIREALAEGQTAEEILAELRMVGAPPEIIAEAERILAATMGTVGGG